MKTIFLGTVGAAAAVLSLGAGSAVAASHTGPVTVLKYVATDSGQVGFGRSQGAGAGDLVANSKPAGFFVLSFKFTKTSGTAGLTADVKGGFIYAVLHLNSKNNNAFGPVTGGTGKYTGAEGTVAAIGTGKHTHNVTITLSG